MARPRIEHTSANRAALKDIPLSELLLPRIDMREQRTPEQIDRLAKSIREKGLLQPILVTPRKDKYEIVLGTTRFKAFMQLNKPTIPAFVVKMNKAQILGARAAENLDRDNITPWEEAVYVGELVNELKMPNTKIARLLNKSDAWVSQRLAIFHYPTNLLEALRSSKVSFSVARELSKVHDEGTLNHYLTAAINNGATPRVVAGWVQSWLAAEQYSQSQGNTEPTPPIFEPHKPAKGTCFICGQESDWGHLRQLFIGNDCLPVIKEIVRELNNNSPTGQE